jgi:hypothetical protein
MICCDGELIEISVFISEPGHPTSTAGMNKASGKQPGWEIQQVNDEMPVWN